MARNKSVVTILVSWRLKLREDQRKETLQVLDRIADRCYPLTKDFQRNLRQTHKLHEWHSMLLIAPDASKHAEMVQKATEHFPPHPSQQRYVHRQKQR